MSDDLLDGLNPVQLEAVVHGDGPAAGRGRRRLGQDPGAHPPHRPPDPRRGRLAVRDPGHHLHQQGRRRDEAAGRPRWSGRSPRRCGCRTFHSACVRILRRDASRLGYPVELHDLRPGRRRAPHRLRHPRPQPRPQEVPAPGACTPPSARPRTTASASSEYTDAGAGHLRAQDRRRLPRVPGPPAARPAPWTSTTCSRITVELFQTAPRRARALPAAVPSTSWSTSTRTPTGSRTSSCCCCGRAPPQRHASWATATSRSTSFRGADMRNILEFEQAFPDVTIDRARAELPLDPDHPRRRQRGHRQQPRPQAQGAVDRVGPRRARIVRYHADDEGDEAQWVAHADRRTCTTAATTAGATSPSSTAPTRRAASSKSSSCAPASRTRSSAAPGSTTGARSRTRSPTCEAVVNPADEVSVKRVLNVPKRGVGDSIGRPARRVRRQPRRARSCEALRQRRRRPGVGRPGGGASSSSSS